MAYQVLNSNIGLDEVVDTLKDAKAFTTPEGNPVVILDTESEDAWVRGAYPDYDAQWFPTTREGA